MRLRTLRCQFMRIAADFSSLYIYIYICRGTNCFINMRWVVSSENVHVLSSDNKSAA